jgi:hypothetical protein
VAHFQYSTCTPKVLYDFVGRSNPDMCCSVMLFLRKAGTWYGQGWHKPKLQLHGSNATKFSGNVTKRVTGVVILKNLIYIHI